MKQSKTLITGASGFIGTHLKKRLRKQGHEVMELPHEMLQDRIELTSALQFFRPEYIYHLAAYGNMHNQKEADEIFQANIVGTYNLLWASSEVQYKAFINFGTSSEYGKKDKPMTEDMVVAPETMYAATKAAGTYLSQVFAKQLDKPIATVRPFSVFGEYEAEFRFIPRIIYCLHNPQVMDVDIKGIHDWIYIEDFLDGLEIVVKNIKKLQGEVVNIGTGIQTTNSRMIEYLERLSGRKLLANYIKGTRPNDSSLWFNGSKKLEKLGWKPKYTLEQALKRIYASIVYD